MTLVDKNIVLIVFLATLVIALTYGILTFWYVYIGTKEKINSLLLFILKNRMLQEYAEYQNKEERKKEQQDKLLFAKDMAKWKKIRRRMGCGE